MNYSQRVADRAQGIQFVRLLLTVLAFPFYALGWVIGVLWLLATWVIAAVAVGVGDGRRRQASEPT